MKLSCQINGRSVSLEVPPFRRLLDVLREDLSLTGSKEGCGEGECGACNVILGGELVNSCIVPAIQAQGAEILTVEAVKDSPIGAAVQESFCAHGGAQCGICTPGMIVAAYWLALNKDRLPRGAGADAVAGVPPKRTGGQGEERPRDPGMSAARMPATIRELLAGNLCRCTGYDLIVRSVEKAIEGARP